MVARLAVGFAALALVAGATAGGFKVPSADFVPADPAAPGDFGESVAVSADGATVLVGGDRSGTATAVAVYTRAGSSWTKQAELTPTSLTTNAGFGAAVALSADGNTAIVGDTGLKTVAQCASDGGCTSASGLPSAVWIFARSGTTWTQQGPALSPPTASGVSGFGSSVALSADGSTALIGGPSDTPGTDVDGNATNLGAAWVFTRTGSGWQQQGSKLTGAGGVVPGFGRTVALSADGKTALIGGDQDGGAPAFPGAVWTFARSGSAWKQVGTKLALDDPDGTTSGFGSTLALSGSGTTALIGGSTAGLREVWEFTRTAKGWKQGLELPTFSSIDFGQSLGLTTAGTEAVIGTSNGAGPGSAYVFGAP
jgi:hypothetical protein